MKYYARVQWSTEAAAVKYNNNLSFYAHLTRYISFHVSVFFFMHNNNKLYMLKCIYVDEQHLRININTIYIPICTVHSIHYTYIHIGKAR